MSAFQQNAFQPNAAQVGAQASSVITKTASDSCAAVASDIINITTPLALIVTDSCAVQSTDVINVITPRAIATTDSLAVPALESSPVPLALSSVVDACAVQSTDSFSRFDITYATDSCAVVAAEQWRSVIATELAGTGIAFSHWEVQDTVVVPVTDVGTSNFDQVKIGLSDATPAIAVFISVSDSITVNLVPNSKDVIPIGLEEAASITVVLSATDACAVQISENALATAIISTSDAAAVQATESARIVATMSVVDSAGIGSTEWPSCPRRTVARCKRRKGRCSSPRR
jgi:hypothetical protein